MTDDSRVTDHSRVTETEVQAYLDALDEPRRGEVRTLHELIHDTLPDLESGMGSGIIGYGRYRYRYLSGREGESALVGLSSRKQYISLYVQCAIEDKYLAERYVERLPKANIGKACVRFKRLADVDLEVVRELLAEAGRIGPPFAVSSE